MLLVALLGAVCGIPTASKKQSGELNRDAACSKYVSLTGNEGRHNKVDNAWCDKNCRAGFCPKESCRCFTDPEPEPDAANAEAVGGQQASVRPSRGLRRRRARWIKCGGVGREE